MRSGAEALCGYLKTRKKILLIKAIEYFSIIFMFAVGAGFGSLAADRWGYTLDFGFHVHFCL